ncbi:hypothetical protein AVEN_77530-1 [Araneus ventricosus]|uniref:Uncharacterized protein n=1 Tax=Araneus ventricosus TaxID=182803 RepID=A0A4Y2F3A7_ARAVE|nr:hypothetical protein AVEN_77530-1 [Araneus ventricosus]
MGTLHPPIEPHKPHLISSPVTEYYYLKGKPYQQPPPYDDHFQSITQCDNRWVDKGTVITQPPSFVLQRECASVSLVSVKTAKR